MGPTIGPDDVAAISASSSRRHEHGIEPTALKGLVRVMASKEARPGRGARVQGSARGRVGPRSAEAMCVCCVAARLGVASLAGIDPGRLTAS